MVNINFLYSLESQFQDWDETDRFSVLISLRGAITVVRRQFSGHFLNWNFILSVALRNNLKCIT